MIDWRTMKEDARKVVHQALDLGIRLFDHADVYGFGKSEEIFGEILDLKTPSRQGTDSDPVQVHPYPRPGADPL